MKFKYLVFLGMLGTTCYLYAYWMPFGIDPFPYLRASDVGMYALRSLLTMGLVAVGFLCFSVLDGIPEEGDAEPRPSWRRDVLIVAIAFILFLVGIDKERLELWGCSALCVIGLGASFRLTELKTLEELSPIANVRHRMIVGVFLVPMLSVAAGVFASVLVQKSDGPKVYGISSLKYQDLVGTVYLGRLGECEFFRDLRYNVTVVVKSDALEGMSLRVTSEPQIHRAIPKTKS